MSRKKRRTLPQADPYAIGFFARLNDLTLEDVLEHVVFGHLVASKEDWDEFLDGYEQAEEEILADRFADLEADLRDIEVHEEDGGV